MTKQYTRSEVASLNDGKKKTLIILHDKVYEVTNFLNEHPGGEEILIDHGGIDGSEDFDDVGHSQDAFELMQKFRVGELVESERSNKEPKKSWTSNYATHSKQPQSDQKSPLMLVAIVVVLAAILYFAYL